MRIEKKIWPEYFEKILTGEKNFEVRLADWECKKGDILVLREWDPGKKDYTGRVLEKEAAYVLKTKDVKFFTPEEVGEYGWQIISFK
jgi:ribosomal protein S17